MCNYSLVLRNCEHVTKYVVYGKWFSLQVIPRFSPFILCTARYQRNLKWYHYFFNKLLFKVMKSSSGIFNKYIKYLSVSKLINTPPPELVSATPIAELRTDLQDQWQFTPIYDKAQTSYEARKDSFNILLIGPTGMYNSCYTSPLFPSR